MRVAVHSTAPVGEAMASPAIRAFELARELARDHDVELLAPGGRAPGGVRLVPADGARQLARYDAVIAQKLPPATLAALAGSTTRVIFDLYTPALAEGLVSLAAEPPDKARGLLLHAEALVQRFAAASADAFICASERQRDFWLGVLGLAGRINPRAVREDPLLRQLIDVVPFGVPSEPIRAAGRVLKGVVPGIAESDRVLLWSGGIVDWADAETVINALDLLSARRPNLRLYFLGSQNPPQTEEERRARALADELEATGRTVFFSERWVPYDERASYLVEADVGVAAYRDTFEDRLAYRARLLDYVWAGLPIVTTRGDVLGDLVGSRPLGRAVGSGDVRGYARGLEELLESAAHAEAVRNLEQLRPALEWPRAVEPLRRLLEAETVSPPLVPRRLLVEDRVLRARISLALRLRRARRGFSGRWS
jgi:glycosyltransferase involved in cell wall biosynthesis